MFGATHLAHPGYPSSVATALLCRGCLAILNRNAELPVHKDAKGSGVEAGGMQAAAPYPKPVPVKPSIYLWEKQQSLLAQLVGLRKAIHDVPLLCRAFCPGPCMAADPARRLDSPKPTTISTKQLLMATAVSCADPSAPSAAEAHTTGHIVKAQLWKGLYNWIIQQCNRESYWPSADWLTHSPRVWMNL